MYIHIQLTVGVSSVMEGLGVDHQLVKRGRCVFPEPKPLQLELLVLMAVERSKSTETVSSLALTGILEDCIKILR